MRSSMRSGADVRLLPGCTSTRRKRRSGRDGVSALQCGPAAAPWPARSVTYACCGLALRLARKRRQARVHLDAGAQQQQLALEARSAERLPRARRWPAAPHRVSAASAAMLSSSATCARVVAIERRAMPQTRECAHQISLILLAPGRPMDWRRMSSPLGHRERRPVNTGGVEVASHVAAVDRRRRAAAPAPLPTVGCRFAKVNGRRIRRAGETASAAVCWPPMRRNSLLARCRNGAGHGDGRFAGARAAWRPASNAPGRSRTADCWS